MVKYISMLRGINISGHKLIKMEELRALYESLGFENVRSYIQSGNVIFECPDSDVSELEMKIENEIEETFGFPVNVTIRTKKEFQEVIENNPFYGETRREDIKKLHVTFLSDTPTASSLQEIEGSTYGPDQMVIAGKEIYVFCPDGYGRTKFTNNFFEKKLKLSATSRIWKTVNRLYDMVSS